jgi:putative ABC transport system ATP-binding protein
MILLENLGKTYRNGAATIAVLRDVSLHIREGEFVAIVGASGSGKSTLLNVLGLLDGYNLGRYLLAGNDTEKLSDRRAAELRNRLLGFVFQSFHLLPQKCAWENVALPLHYAGVGKKERKRRAHELLERLGLAERAHHRPNELSGGQRQRVAIARALVTDPKVVLADEPTGNLDSESSAEVMTLLREIHEQGRTVVLVTHAPEVAQAASRVIAVRDGQVFEEATYGRANLLSQPGLAVNSRHSSSAPQPAIAEGGSP